MITAEEYDRAPAIAGDRPSLEIGGKIELREAVNMD